MGDRNPVKNSFGVNRTETQLGNIFLIKTSYT